MLLVDWAKAWKSLYPAKKSERAWGTLFFAMVWTTWEIRNQVVFEGKVVIVVQVVDMVKIRVAWWFKHHGCGSKETMTAILFNLKDLCTDVNIGKLIKIEEWTPPAHYGLKFN